MSYWPLSLVKRLVKGQKLLPSEEDQNKSDIEGAVNALYGNLSVVLNPDGTLKNNAVSTASIQDRAVTLAKLAFLSTFYAVDTGAANAMAISFTTAATAYAAGMVFWVKVVATNTGASTLNVDSLGAVAVKQVKNGALTDVDAGNLVGTGVYCFVHDGTQFVVVNPSPVAVGTVVQQTTFDNLGSFYALPGAGLNLEITHSLPAIPFMVRAVLVCTSAVNGYSVHDELNIEAVATDTAGDNNFPAFAVTADATKITVSENNNWNDLYYIQKAGASSTFDPTKWKLKVYTLHVPT